MEKPRPLKDFELNKEIFDRLQTLKKNRVHCDYEFHIPDDKVDDPNGEWSVFTLDDLCEKAKFIFDKLPK